MNNIWDIYWSNRETLHKPLMQHKHICMHTPRVHGITICLAGIKTNIYHHNKNIAHVQCASLNGVVNIRMQNVATLVLMDTQPVYRLI